MRSTRFFSTLLTCAALLACLFLVPASASAQCGPAGCSVRQYAPISAPVGTYTAPVEYALPAQPVVLTAPVPIYGYTYTTPHCGVTTVPTYAVRKVKFKRVRGCSGCG